MDGGAWWVAVHEVAKSQTRLGNFTFTFHFHALEKETATLYSCLENPRDRGAWWAAVYGVAQSRTRLKRLSSSSACPQARRRHTPVPRGQKFLHLDPSPSTPHLVYLFICCSSVSLIISFIINFQPQVNVLSSVSHPTQNSLGCSANFKSVKGS